MKTSPKSLIGLLAIWVFAYSCAPACLGAETGSSTFALDKEAAALNSVLTNQIQRVNQVQQKEAASASTRLTLILILAAAVGGTLCFLRFGPQIGRVFNRDLSGSEPGSLGEAKAYTKFADNFVARSTQSPGTPAPANASAHGPAPVDDPVERFRANAPKTLATLRATFSGMGCAPDAEAKLKILTSLTTEIVALKDAARLPGLVPFWQMASALEGLLGQLAKKPADINASPIRTIASALDLLNSLCSSGLKPDLATNPPVRVLAVDDDPICRYAISFALQKVFSAPDLAADGKAALALGADISYDVIFLDIEMPGMDGFELCTRLRETPANQATPVVFVTRHSDFDSRVKSSRSGARELIGKPFGAFEIAVKALTMVLRRRLEANNCQQLALPNQTPAAAAELAAKALPEPATPPAARLALAPQ